MCRLFALRANEPTAFHSSLISEANSLQNQSRCDSRFLSHDHGWGIGYYVDGTAHCRRSILPCNTDPQFAAVVDSIAPITLLAHVRLASVGAAALKNTHPFVHGNWMFVHNGTLYGFQEQRLHIRSLITPSVRRHIRGETDSEHAFYLALSRLEGMGAALESPVDPDLVCRVLIDTIRILHEICPGAGDNLSQFNFVLTNGQVLVASRWRHTLYWLERRGTDFVGYDRPLEDLAHYHAVAIASEPTTPELWAEVPDRSLICIDGNLNCRFVDISDIDPPIPARRASE